MPPCGYLAASSAPARLRLVAAAKVRLTVGAAVRRTLGLVKLRQWLFAYLVVVVRHLASVSRLHVAQVLFGFHVGSFQDGVRV